MPGVALGLTYTAKATLDRRESQPVARSLRLLGGRRAASRQHEREKEKAWAHVLDAHTDSTIVAFGHRCGAGVNDMVQGKDPYSILGVNRDASEDEIRRAYRKLARKYHPDVNAGKKSAEERFKEISAAYEVVGNPDRRKLYDEFGAAALSPGFDPARARQYQRWAGGARQAPHDSEVVDFDLGDIFADLFGARPPGRERHGRGSDLHATVEIDLAQALRGTEVELMAPDGSPERVKVRIPPGADNGSRLRVPGRGQKGRRGGPAGDLIIETRVRPHPYFRREGLDLHLLLPVTLDEAYNGAAVELPTPDGVVTLRVPPRSQSGQRLRLKGKGVTRGGEHGDLYAELQVLLPDGDSPELARAARQANAAYSQSPRANLRF